jgi:cysteine desulfurase
MLPRIFQRLRHRFFGGDTSYDAGLENEALFWRKALADGGNPNAVHAAGRRARARVETARARVADLVGTDPTAVVFSSGGTESNAQAVASAIAAGCERLIVSATEHPCVAEAANASGVPVEMLPVDASGVVDLEWLVGALGRPGRALVAIHHANNESGVIQPIAGAAALVRAAGGWLHAREERGWGHAGVETTPSGCRTVWLICPSRTKGF